MFIGTIRRAGSPSRGAVSHRAVLRVKPAASCHRRAQQVLARFRQWRRLQRHLRYGTRRCGHQQRQVNIYFSCISLLAWSRSKTSVVNKKNHWTGLTLRIGLCCLPLMSTIYWSYSWKDGFSLSLLKSFLLLFGNYFSILCALVSCSSSGNLHPRIFCLVKKREFLVWCVSDWLAISN